MTGAARQKRADKARAKAFSRTTMGLHDLFEASSETVFFRPASRGGRSRPSVKITPGRRVVDKWGRAWMIASDDDNVERALVRMIDAAIRRAQVKAWNECAKRHGVGSSRNPYRNST